VPSGVNMTCPACSKCLFHTSFRVCVVCSLQTLYAPGSADRCYLLAIRTLLHRQHFLDRPTPGLRRNLIWTTFSLIGKFFDPGDTTHFCGQLSQFLIPRAGFIEYCRPLLPSGFQLDQLFLPHSSEFLDTGFTYFPDAVDKIFAWKFFLKNWCCIVHEPQKDPKNICDMTSCVLCYCSC